MSMQRQCIFKILAGEMEPDEGSYKWGVTTSQSYFPKDNTEIFDTDDVIVDWLTQFSEIKDATYVRGFLGRMLLPVKMVSRRCASSPVVKRCVFFSPA